MVNKVTVKIFHSVPDGPYATLWVGNTYQGESDDPRNHDVSLTTPVLTADRYAHKMEHVLKIEEGDWITITNHGKVRPEAEEDAIKGLTSRAVEKEIESWRENG